MSVPLKRAKCLVVYAVTICLIGLVICCLKFDALLFFHHLELNRKADDLNFVSKDRSRNRSQLFFAHFVERDMNLNHTQTRAKVREKDITSKSNTILSPFIDKVFHVDVSSNSASSYRTDHTILFWNSPNWFHQWSSSSNMSQCVKYTNCKQTFDRSLYKTSKAVVFNLPEMGVDRVPPLRLNPDQAWVFFTLESPLHINHIYDSSNWHNVFNWSWTYHPNADIFHPYGVLVKEKIIPSRKYSNIFRKKTKFAAWAVSNCFAPSRRNEFVYILKRFVDVDVFGTCGKTAPVNLEKYISEHYKFYLGFENSLCENYMTEKFFHYYKLDVITVLRGHTNYTRYLPSDSFIDTDNFTSISALAKFMKDLAGNEEKYVSYLKVKDKYTIHEREYLFKDAVCDLCEKLNNIEKNRKTYGDIYKWLGACIGAKDLIVNSSGTFDVTV